MKTRWVISVKTGWVISVKNQPSKWVISLKADMLANLDRIGEVLSKGAVVVFEQARIRIRLLPVGES
jgi:hypothetical protein